MPIITSLWHRLAYNPLNIKDNRIFKLVDLRNIIAVEDVE